MTWFKLFCNRRELQLLGTLNGGQSFRWSHNEETNEWTGIFSKTMWKIRQEDYHLMYRIDGTLLDESCTLIKRDNKRTVVYNEEMFRKLLENYFRLDVDLEKLYKDWAAKDKLFETAGQQFYGIRMLRQEPVENLFSFICSQNNHISRISSMVEKLCTHYGEEICKIDGKIYYSFPEVEELAHPWVEKELRQLGFGYRAKFIQGSAAYIVKEGGGAWFRRLASMPYESARAELMKLPGIGPKVADCICLMSLDHLSALPVDTHVYQIAAQHYLPHLRGKKNVTDKMYKEIGNHFREVYGDKAGWAHTVLFCADLKKFQNTNANGAPKAKKKRNC